MSEAEVALDVLLKKFQHIKKAWEKDLRKYAPNSPMKVTAQAKIDAYDLAIAYVKTELDNAMVQRVKTRFAKKGK